MNTDYTEEKLYKGANLIILIASTVAALILFVEVLLLDWERGNIPIIVCMLIYSWYISFAQKYNDIQRIHLYVAFLMYYFFIYGIHQTTLSNLALSIVCIMVVLFIARLRTLIWMSAFSYFFTVLYNLAREELHWQKVYDISIWQLLFQFFLVILVAIVAHLFITERIRQYRYHLEEKKKWERQEEQAKEQIRIVAKELGLMAHNNNGERLLLRDALQNGDNYDEQMNNLALFGTVLEKKLDDLNDFSHLLRGRMTLLQEAYNAVSILSLCKMQRQNHNVNHYPDLIVQIDPMIPKVMYGDPQKILKIIQNLVENGFLYTKRGGVQLKIYTHQYDNEYNLCIEVNDTGIGIAQVEMERLLEAINDEKTPGYRPGGLGLGLYLVSGYVKSMGGFFRMESKLGEGTQVCVSIPQRVIDAAPSMSYDKKCGVCLVYEQLDYEHDRLNEFYEEFFFDLSQKLGIPAYAIANDGELKELIAGYRKVCLIVDYDQYIVRREYYDELKDVYLTVLTDVCNQDQLGSNVHILKKPVGTSEILYTIEEANKTADRRRNEASSSQIDISQLSIETLTKRAFRKKGIRSVMIVTDSMSDLPPEISKRRGIPVIPFRIFTENASFLDGLEVSQECAINYLKEHKGIYTMAPEEDELREFFEYNLQFAKHIIYVSTAKKVSVSYDRAVRVAENMPRVSVVNSGQVSGGVALMAMMADSYARGGKSPEEVERYLYELRSKVKTTFLIENLDHLAYLGKVSKYISVLVRTFMVHPIIKMKHDAMEIGGIRVGSMTRAKENYIRRIIKKKRRIDHRNVFIGSVGISWRELGGLREQLITEGDFDNVISRRASAAIAINCGVGTFGIIYVEK
ncbi:EDD domain protein, DegV family [Eubacterium oxidoreducens]|uniref:histidine kinase n=2 Tax=Eubacterium oxidoreducens TaxID=1732 RepID=A0A1G6A4J6_EUBOX|nr:EDD domain protein, DegV family [Eubacterium oxidoreducens]